MLLENKDRGRRRINQVGSVSKLRERYEGPYAVESMLNNGQNVRLRLREGDKSQPIFHVSKVKMFILPRGTEDRYSGKKVDQK